MTILLLKLCFRYQFSHIIFQQLSSPTELYFAAEFKVN